MLMTLKLLSTKISPGFPFSSLTPVLTFPFLWLKDILNLIHLNQNSWFFFHNSPYLSKFSLHPIELLKSRILNFFFFFTPTPIANLIRLTFWNINLSSLIFSVITLVASHHLLLGLLIITSNWTFYFHLQYSIGSFICNTLYNHFPA